MAEPDNTRASARRHTTQLLKMLRGYGPIADPAPSTEPETTTSDRSTITVAEAATVYAKRLESVSNDQASPDAVPAGLEPPIPPRERIGPSPVATVGETLSRQQGTTLGELMARADRLVRLSRIFRAYLPPHLHDHAVLIQMDEDRWIVHADASGWATRLRYALHNIRETLGQQLGISLPKPHIRVVPAALPPPSRPPLTLTKRNAKLLEVAARNLSDARLSAALRRLATYAGPTRESTDNGRR